MKKVLLCLLLITTSFEVTSQANENKCSELFVDAFDQSIKEYTNTAQSVSTKNKIVVRERFQSVLLYHIAMFGETRNLNYKNLDVFEKQAFDSYDAKMAVLHEEQPELEEFIQLNIQNFSANESALFFSSS